MQLLVLTHPSQLANECSKAGFLFLKNPSDGFKGILNYSLICSKGSLGEGSQKTPKASFCSLLDGHFCIGFYH